MTQEIEIVSVEKRPVNRYERYATRLNRKTYTYENRKSRLYIWADDWDAWEDFAGGRFANDVKGFRKALPAIYERLGIPAGTKAVWSQTAGCSCPCSPGFIIDYRGVEQPVDFAVVVKPFEKVETEEYKARREALGLA